MRILGFGFGLVALLIGVAIMFKMESDELPATLQADKQAQQQVQQIAGVTANGGPVEDTYTLKPQMRPDGSLGTLIVTRLDPASPLAQYFGLQLNDQIVSAGYSGVQLNVRDAADEETAELNVRDAYARSGQLVVLRNGQQLTLPAPASQPPPAAPQAQAQPQPQPQPAQPSSAQQDPMKAIENQLHSVPAN
ncbi:MAG: hypothetical protein ABSF29_10675 [Tepidisphaeraceae bacterium]|jgi:hypothetical protein